MGSHLGPAAATVAAVTKAPGLPTPSTGLSVSDGSVISAEDTAPARSGDSYSSSVPDPQSCILPAISRRDGPLDRTPTPNDTTLVCETKKKEEDVLAEPESELELDLDLDLDAGLPDSAVEQTPSLLDDWLSADSQTLCTPTVALEDVSPSTSFYFPLMNSEDDKAEEIIRPENGDINISNAPPVSPDLPSKDAYDPPIYDGPLMSAGSPEMLLMRFDRHTCGILSVKDGATENPWRTLIWPLAADSPALYHAICSLAAFHCSKKEPYLRVHGMDHMRQSVRCLARGIGTMRTDVALATTLSLAFAEAWDRHISTGIQHLRGAKALVSQALAEQRRKSLGRNDAARLRFLYNTWMYASVIARLTSTEEVGYDDFAQSLLTGSPNQVQEIDPLMGCASTLFPLIGRVASLVQKVRTTATNSIAVISQAFELKTLIEQWEPPKYFEPPEDPTSDVQHSYQTAQAYRWATLLYLHQAVPEIPSESAYDLAKRVLVMLATVPITSRTTVVHIYPLLTASCEVESEEDRNWVLGRWAAMQSRLMVGNIDRCVEVIREVWARRDEYAMNWLENPRTPFVMPMDTMMKRRDGLDGRDSDMGKGMGIGIGMGMGMGPRAQDWLDLYDVPDNPKRRFSDNSPVRSGFSPTLSLSTMSCQRRSSFESGFEDLEYEMSVRGSLHWAGVMKNWNWEGTLRFFFFSLKGCDPS